MNYTLQAIKTAGGEETPRFEAQVRLNNTVIATVSNSGTGGCCNWHWLDRAAEAPFEAWIKTVETEAIEAADMWVYGLIEKAEITKTLMRKSLKKAVFILTGEKPAEGHRSINKPDSPEVRAFILAKYAAKKPLVFDRGTKEFVAL
jgi:hypothetical protein